MHLNFKQFYDPVFCSQFALHTEYCDSDRGTFEMLTLLSLGINI